MFERKEAGAEGGGSGRRRESGERRAESGQRRLTRRRFFEFIDFHASVDSRASATTKEQRSPAFYGKDRVVI